MDGHPNPKSKKWRGNMYSETRYAVIKWLEVELPKVTGDVLIVSAGNWPVPKQLLTNKGVKSIKTFDERQYGDTKNGVDFEGDVHNMPAEWTNKWDCIINNQSIECYKNPFKAMDEMHRVLKPGGKLLIDAPFAYRWFGDEAWPGKPKKKNRVYDYWRISKDGWEVLTEKFSKTDIDWAGPNVWDPYVYLVTAIK